MHKQKFISLISLIFLLSFYSQLYAQKNTYSAPFTKIAPQIDGLVSEDCWSNAQWDTFKYELFNNPMPSAADFSGRYKVLWDENQIYILIEVVDDILNSDNPPLSDWWKDDCVEVFLDEDHSGGRHEVASWINVSQYGACNNCAYNAFAYHTDAVTFDAVDQGQDGSPATYNDNCKAVVTKDGTNYTWEFAIKQFGADFILGGANTPLKLKLGQVLGFCMAYCDNDTRADERENFIGTQAGSADAWINADLFGDLNLLSCDAVITETADIQGNITGVKATSLPFTNYSWYVVENDIETQVGSDSILTNYNSGTYKLKVSNQACEKSTIFTSTLHAGEQLINRDDISVYPNPASNQLSIHAVTNITSVSIYNPLGSLVCQNFYPAQGNSVIIEDFTFPKGIYVVNVSTSAKNYSRQIFFDN